MRTTKSCTGWIAFLIVVAAASSGANGGNKMLNTGDLFVDFELEAHDGSTIRGADLSGQPFLLYFYPKADTPG